MESWERIKYIIEQEGMNKNSFSEAIGLSSNVTITRLLNEKRKASPTTCKKIAERFPKYNLRWLLTGEGEMLRPIPQVSGNIFVGDSNKNVQLGHGSKIMHGNEADQEVMSSLQARIIELETELIKKNGEIAVKDETIKGKDKEIKGLQEQLILKTEMITLLQNHNKK